MDLIGVNIGGTKVSICLGDARGNIVSSLRVPTASLGGPKRGLPQLVMLINGLLNSSVVGLALPGPISSSRGMMLTPPNLPQWVNVPIVDYFIEHLRRPIFMDNDGNAGACAEWHFVLDLNGPLCGCGQKGCFEAFCGRLNIARRLQERIRQGAKTQILEEAGSIEKVDMKSLARAAQKKDPIALEEWKVFIERLSQGIGILLMTLNPDAIILGTIATQTSELLMEPLRATLPRFAWGAPLNHCRIEASQLGDSRGEL